MPLAQSGRHRKKALVIISDGNDTSSHTDVPALKRMIRETEVLVYAIGIDSQTESGYRRADSVTNASCQRRPAAAARADSVAVPDARRRRRSHRRRARRRFRRRAARQQYAGRATTIGVNVAALRDITDDSGGRTEIVRGARDLDPATAGIADELSKPVLPRVRGDRREGRALAHDPRRGAQSDLPRARAAGIRRDSLMR